MIDLAHLPRTGDYAAPIDDRVQAVDGAVFLHQKFRREFRCAVKTAMPGQREIGRNAVGGPAGSGAGRVQLEAIAMPLERQPAQWVDRIYSARRQEDHVGAMGTRRFQTMCRSGQVRVDDVRRVSRVASVY